ncbi:shikimate kinase [Methyloversatilis sp.]|uniref:shikimate kinase n=1 Tax=Methyloversatilis sp. TaxID=2569862 RepID=UPI002736E6B5|nr:shikimate kinase [Methyloversatilis sp.]MDP2870127.1 shikimate kinase [Methyloversatilis sp.]MDP3288755.1 shikimate kinase [Methyloversatilis sp.]MDP3457419.1 shikimate kinase [Methyloversatilis sp.]MDP3578624.1 shikimate kinase [Methyloversatilis sp.]
MEHSDNIILVGLMGAGKTTVGRQLARRLRKRFVDCDHEIEARTGVSIPTIFEIEGEAGFRRRESAVIEALAQEAGLVLATGGGAVLDPMNRKHLKAGGWVVYLDVPPDVLWHRTRGDRNRPLLQVEDPRARVRELHGIRDPLYREVADFVAESGHGSPLTIVRQLEREYLSRCAA